VHRPHSVGKFLVVVRNKKSEPRFNTGATLPQMFESRIDATAEPGLTAASDLLGWLSLPQLQNCFRVQRQWLWSYFTGQRSSRLYRNRRPRRKSPGVEWIRRDDSRLRPCSRREGRDRQRHPLFDLASPRPDVSQAADALSAWSVDVNSLFRRPIADKMYIIMEKATYSIVLADKNRPCADQSKHKAREAEGIRHRS
jgi:hypothetical protein